MRRIYEMASRTLIWLGDHAHGSEAVSTLLREIERLGPSEQMELITATSRSMVTPGNMAWSHMLEALPPSSDPRWLALNAFVQRRWFRRVWIIQELAVSREIQLHCRNTQLEWEPLAIAVTLSANIGMIETFSDTGVTSILSLFLIRGFIQMGTKKPLLSLLL